MPLEEASFIMDSAGDSELARFLEGEGMSERIREWLATPEGTVAHDPSWGHNLRRFKFHPLSSNSDMETLIEMAITRKLPKDIDNLELAAIGVEILGADIFRLTLIHRYGLQSEKVKL